MSAGAALMAGVAVCLALNATSGPASDKQSEPLGKVLRASEVVGKSIRNVQGEKLGAVNDLAVDLEAGRIVYVILSHGGMAGIGTKYVAIVPQLLSNAPGDATVRLNLSKEKLEAAPTIDPSKWEDASESNRVVEIYRFYGQHPYFVGFYAPSSTVKVCPLGHVSRTDKIINLPVRNKSDEQLGKVDDLLINLESGRIVQVVISSGGFLGLGDELSVVPPAAFEYDTSRDALVLDASKADLTAAPHFKSTQWPNASDPQYTERVYRAYRVEPYFDLNADNTGQNARDRDGQNLTPLDQSNSPADLETTRRIRQELVAEPGLSINAHNIKVITVNGRVTVRGPVRNEEEKNRVIQIVGRSAPGATLNNQLEVKTADD
jgi:Uncharacterized conserved protein